MNSITVELISNIQNNLPILGLKTVLISMLDTFIKFILDSFKPKNNT